MQGILYEEPSVLKFAIITLVMAIPYIQRMSRD